MSDRPFRVVQGSVPRWETLPPLTPNNPWVPQHPTGPEVWLLVEPCPTCLGRGWDLIQPIEGHDDGVWCPDCDGAGAWVSGYVTATPYPVVGPEQPPPDGHIGDYLEQINDQGLCYTWTGNDGEPDDLVRVRGAVPGGVAIRLEPVPITIGVRNVPCVYEGDTHDGPQWFYNDGEDDVPVPAVGSPVAVRWDGWIGEATDVPEASDE